MFTGENFDGQEDMLGWRDIDAISISDSHAIGLKRDGTVLVVGGAYNGQGRQLVTIFADGTNNLSIDQTGTVEFSKGEYVKGNDVANWSEIVSIACGNAHIVGVRKDGTVLALGDNDEGQCNTKKWRDIVTVSARGNTTIGVKKDGTIIATGSNDEGQRSITKWQLW